jgi:hypothetical protein
MPDLLAKIDAVLAAGHPDSARVGISVGCLRALAKEARKAHTDRPHNLERTITRS